MSTGLNDDDSCERVPRSSPKVKTDTTSWTSLPGEIRYLILEEISSQKYFHWTSCAAVCKEWKNFIEPRNFGRLKLQPSRLDEPEDMTRRTKSLVQYICLNIQLPRYDCRYCEGTEPESHTMQSASIIRKAILGLFSVLSTWEPTGRGLTLELNAYSPSDSKHWFKNCLFKPDDGDSIRCRQNTKTWHDPKHGWVSGKQVEAPGAEAILRLFSSIHLSRPQDLPEVRAVTGFVLRRQLRRLISPQTLYFLWNKLPRLKSIAYEPWRLGRTLATSFDKGV